MFQNSDGTTAAALESPVGLQLDLSRNLTLGSNIVTPAANSTFTSDTGFWSKDTGVTISGGSANWTATAATFQLYKTLQLTVGKYYEATFTISSITSGGLRCNIGGNLGTVRTTAGTYTERLVAGSGTMAITSSGASTTASVTLVSFFEVTGTHRLQATSANRPILSARYNLLLATATLATQNITTVATSYTIYFTGTGTVTLSGTFIGVFSAGTNTFTATAGTLTATVVGSVLTADIRPTNQTVTLPAYQAVVTSSSYDTVGFPQYLKYDGLNSSLSTASINFTATAQMSVFSGLRKLSDAAAGYAIELSVNSTSNSGAFYLSAPNSAAANFGAGSGGTTFVSGASASSFAAPTTQTAQILANISAPSLNLYLNNTSVLSSTSTQGTGNYGNYAMYFGRRAGASSPFNGQEFQTIIVGKTLTAAQITATETYVNSKTKAY
jgi:hypothetical protein